MSEPLVRRYACASSPCLFSGPADTPSRVFERVKSVVTVAWLRRILGTSERKGGACTKCHSPFSTKSKRQDNQQRAVRFGGEEMSEMSEMRDTSEIEIDAKRFSRRSERGGSTHSGAGRLEGCKLERVWPMLPISHAGINNRIA